MKILVSNDDGYFAPGLKLLVENPRKNYQVTVVAPDRNRSGSSSSLTLDKPLHVEKIDEETEFGHFDVYEIDDSVVGLKFLI